MSSNRDPRRGNTQTGRAFRGSQWQIQTWVNCHQEELNRRVIPLLSPALPANATLRWVSPLAATRFAEYQDAEFLEKLELGGNSARLKKRLKQFWPKGGPCWDALAIVEGMNPHGVVLAEAKSHISEMISACKASKVSLKQIEHSLDETAVSLGVTRNSSWTEKYYQSANRYAHLYFLRQMAKIPTWLVNVYFINDESIDHVERAPRSVDEWREQLREVKEQMGLGTSSIPFTAELFIEAFKV